VDPRYQQWQPRRIVARRLRRLPPGGEAVAVLEVRRDPRVGLGVVDRPLSLDCVLEPQAEPETEDRKQRGEPKPAPIARGQPPDEPPWHPPDSTILPRLCEF